MKSLWVNLGQRRSEIIFVAEGDDWAGACHTRLGALSNIVFVSDEHTQHIAESLAVAFGSAAHHLTIPAGETSKCPMQLAAIYDVLAACKADRATPVVAVGGGVVGDLAGYAAATWNRGLPLVAVPTTLLAMVDSSVGGKVGINHTSGKNLIGAFHQPRFVWVDPRYLHSLPDREFRSGLAEVVKYGVILDADFFSFLEANTAAILARDPHIILQIIARSCELKAEVVEQDEFETTGLRAKLNYGHTFAHAYEAVAGYGSWLHGEAVAAGMIAESRLAEALGRIDATVTHRQRELLTALSLPIVPMRTWPIEELLEAMQRDKKNVAGKLRFVLPTKIGEVEMVSDVPTDLVRKVAAS